MVTDFDPFTSDTGWTKLATVGSYALTGGFGTYTPGNSGLDNLGNYRTTPTTSVHGGTFEFFFKTDTTLHQNFMIGISPTAAISYSSNMFAYYVNNDAARIFCWDYSAGANVLGTPDQTANTIHHVVFTNVAGLMHMTYDGTDVYTTAHFPDPTGNPIYAVSGNVDAVNATSGKLYIAQFVATDDGSYLGPVPTGLAAIYDVDTNTIQASCDPIANYSYSFSLDGGTGQVKTSEFCQFDNPTPGSHAVTVASTIQINGVDYTSTFSSPVSVNVPAAGGNDDGEAMLVLGDL